MHSFATIWLDRYSHRLRLFVSIGLGLMLALSWGNVSTRATFAGPNGRVAFARYVPAIDDFNIFAANPDGSNETQLTTVGSGHPDWSPDGSRVAFAYLASNGCTDVACDIEIGIVNADGTGFTQLTSGEPFFRADPAWSPDGRWIAVNSNGIRIIDATTGIEVAQVTDNPYIEDRVPAWSPDGQWLAFTRVRHAKRREQTAIFRVHRDGTALERVTAWGENADNPDWSPDGSRIVFNTKGTVAAPSRITTIRPDGTRETNIIRATGDADFHDPGWSPDGTQVLFQGWLHGPTPIPPHPARERALWIANADGSDLHKVLGEGGGGPEIVDPDWGTFPAAP